MRARVQRRALRVDHLHVLDARRIAVHEPAARDGGVVHAVAGFGVAPVNEPIRREPRIDRDVEQAALAARVDRRKPGDGLGQLPVGGDDAQAARPLGHEHLAVRQERHAPRILERAGDRDDVERDVRLLLGRVGLTRERGLLVGAVRRTRCRRRDSAQRRARVQPGRQRTDPSRPRISNSSLLPVSFERLASRRCPPARAYHDARRDGTLPT